MTPEPAARGADDAHRVVRAQPHVARAERDHQVVAQRPLPIGHGLVDHLRHAGVALHPGGEWGVGATEPDVRHEIGEHDLLDTCLAERWQHAFDVAQEHTVRADHEHSLVLEWEPVRVEQVRRAVQCDHSLAGAGATLHDEHTGLGRTDDLVLLRLDRRHDVAE